MKSMICESLAPCRIFSLTWFLKSSASGAFESAMVWFWHTRQRSSAASVITLCSSAGSAAAGPASFAHTHGTVAARSRNARTLSTAELLHQRQQLFPDDLRRERADAFVADDAELVDHVGLGNAVDAVVDADLAFEVVDRKLIGIAHALQPRQAVFALVLVVEAVERHRAAFGEIEQDRVLLAAGHAPRCPHVEDPDFPEHVLFSECLCGFAQLEQLEVGRGLADERRGHFARIERETDPEQSDERSEDSQGENEAIHGRYCADGTTAWPVPRRTAPAASPRGSGDRLRRARPPAPSRDIRPRSNRRRVCAARERSRPSRSRNPRAIRTGRA